MDIPSVTTWPPHYTVRRSPRARQIFLQIRPEKGLEIVVPNRRQNLDVIGLLNEKRHWIEKTLLRVMPQGCHSEPTFFVPPSSIELQAISNTWQVFYCDSNLFTSTVKLRGSFNHMQLEGNIH